MKYLCCLDNAVEVAVLLKIVSERWTGLLPYSIMKLYFEFKRTKHEWIIH